MRINNKAFTLIELLMATGISVLLLGLVLSIFITTKQFYVTNIVGQNLQRDADIILNKIIRGGREPAGIFRLSEATSCASSTIPLATFACPESLSQLSFAGIDGKKRWVQLSGDGKSIIYHHPTVNGDQDQIIYTAPRGAVLTLRFWIRTLPNSIIPDPVFFNIDVGIDVAITQTILNRTVSGSASTMINLRNHSA